MLSALAPVQKSVTARRPAATQPGLEFATPEVDFSGERKGERLGLACGANQGASSKKGSAWMEKSLFAKEMRHETELTRKAGSAMFLS